MEVNGICPYTERIKIRIQLLSAKQNSSKVVLNAKATRFFI